MSVITSPFEQFGMVQGYGPAAPGNPYNEPIQFGSVPFHDGIDYGAPCGTPVSAPFAGTIVFAGWDDSGYGNKVTLQRSDGAQVFYGHLSAIGVSSGQPVGAGQLLGATGTTGNSTGCHIHIGARGLTGNTLDPSAFPSASGAASPAGPSWPPAKVAAVVVLGVVGVALVSNI